MKNRQNKIEENQQKIAGYRLKVVNRQKIVNNPEKLARYGTPDEEKQNKNTTQYVLDTTICKPTHIT